MINTPFEMSGNIWLAYETLHFGLLTDSYIFMSATFEAWEVNAPLEVPTVHH